MQPICYQPIGVIHSPFREPKGTPIQPAAAKGIEGRVELFPEYEPGLRDLEGFSHIILLYHFHLAKPGPLQRKPFMDPQNRGVFAMRGPSRPNRIGLSIVQLLKVNKQHLAIQDVDVIDGTPLLDIKPYVPAFDARSATRIGWLAHRVQQLSESRDDGRFIQS
jgi:tRNA-Thr(GGU) m(6)t(6)A37 methyltransferase TsaA